MGVFRQTYTREIPAGGERVRAMVKRRGKEVEVDAVRFKDDGRWVSAPLTKDGRRCMLHSPTWYGWVGGVAVPLCTNKAAAEMMLADRILKVERGEAGLNDPFGEQKGRALVEHLADFQSELKAGLVGKRGVPCESHVRTTVTRIRTVLADGCSFTHLTDIDLVRVQECLEALTRDCGALELPAP